MHGDRVIPAALFSARLPLEASSLHPRLFSFSLYLFVLCSSIICIHVYSLGIQTLQSSHLRLTPSVQPRWQSTVESGEWRVESGEWSRDLCFPFTFYLSALHRYRHPLDVQSAAATAADYYPPLLLILRTQPLFCRSPFFSLSLSRARPLFRFFPFSLFPFAFVASLQSDALSALHILFLLFCFFAFLLFTQDSAGFQFLRMTLSHLLFIRRCDF